MQKSSTRSESCRRMMEKRWAGRRDYWQGVIDRQQQSGLTITKFCAEEAVHPTSFYAWRKKLAESSSVVATFSEVSISGPVSFSSGVRLELPGGMTIHLDRDFDPSTLSLAVATLRGEGE